MLQSLVPFTSVPNGGSGDLFCYIPAFPRDFVCSSEKKVAYVLPRDLSYLTAKFHYVRFSGLAAKSNNYTAYFHICD